MKKNKRYVRICAALLCAVLCLSVNVAPAMAAKVTQADIDALKGNAASLDKKQKEIQSKLNSLKNDKAAAVQKKTLLDDQIANTNAKISNTEAQISDYNALISQAETELADAQQREEAQYELFCKRVREMEERGTISYWSVLFKANSFSDLLGSLDFINEVMDYDRRVIQDLQTLQAEIAEKKAGLEANKAALEAAKKGEAGDLTPRQKHTRECYVVLEEGADPEAVAQAIITMPHYFDEYDTSVTFITEEEMLARHGAMPHAGEVLRHGITGADGKQTAFVGFEVAMDSNPQFTGSILLAFARGVYRFYREGRTGCFTAFDMPLSALSPMSREKLLSTML